MADISCIGHRTYGYCKKHGHWVYGKIIEGCPRRKINGIPIATVTHKVQADCGTIGVIIQGSSISSIDGQQVAREGDPFDGKYEGKIIEGWTTRSSK